MKSSIFVLVVLVLFGVICVPALGASYSSAPTGTETVDNETSNISTSSWTAVSSAGQTWYDNETVWYNESAVATSEYEWSTSNGSIRAVENGTLASASTVNVTYTYEARGDWVQLGEGAVTLLVAVLGVLTLLVAGLFLLGTASLFASAGGR
ncbi:hypothetical protein [Haloarchaeobius sp. DFWS5]|uniref:hypothetical protein n=1 Tax=Haloarchaeobius sp. DFWS5 TaxID=3446114 RepID=UPI003EBEA6D5